MNTYNKSLSSAPRTTPTIQEVTEYMNLHNEDEVGIDNQWSFDDAEYHLLLSDKYNDVKIDTRPQSKWIEVEKIKSAILRREKYYIGSGSIPLPSCQTAGTSKQIDAHAQQLAQNFYDDFVKKNCVLDTLTS